MLRLPKALVTALLVGVLALAALSAAGCGGSSSRSDSKQSSSTPVCGYYYEWKSAWKFALQPDPHAAYTYVIPKVTSDPIGYEISGPFPVRRVDVVDDL